MKVTSIFTLALAAVPNIPTVLCAPAAFPQNLPPQQGPQYNLRIVAPGQPWHNRFVVQLPSSGLFGLDNFTSHPQTPPVKLALVKIPHNNTYALRLPFFGDDLSHTPYIAAIATEATRTALFGTIYVPDPTRRAIDLAPSACPEAVVCTADAFSLDTNKYTDQGDDGSAPGSLGRLSFEGFPGHWAAVKDAPKGEGWHIYWKTDMGHGKQIKIDVVPVERSAAEMESEIEDKTPNQTEDETENETEDQMEAETESDMESDIEDEMDVENEVERENVH